MIRHRLLFLITGLFVLLMLMPLRAGAAGMDIGMSTWYCWWQPSWNNEGAGYKVKPAFFYGPGLSFRLPANVTISTSFLYARVKTESPLTAEYPSESSSKKTRIIQRYDSDTTISYSFTRFFKLFAGFKYSNYQFDGEQMIFFPPSLLPFLVGIEKNKYNEFAPALGVGFNIRLIENFFLLITASVLYDRCYISNKVYVIAMNSPPQIFPYPLRYWPVDKIGANAQVSFAYMIQPVNTSISVGFRYQVFKIVKSEPGNEDYSEYYDHFYGVTASVIYRIEFGKKKEQIEDTEKQELSAR
jgi:hypothetical protein